MNYIDFPGPNSQFLFERMMTDAIVFMVLAVSVIALSACLFYLATLLWLMRHEASQRKPVARTASGNPRVSTAKSFSGLYGMRNKGLVRIATLAGIFIVALLVSQMLPQIAGMVGGR